MRRELLEWLVCPACQEADWRLESAEASETEIVEDGWLECATCETRYSIEGGILDLLPNPDDAVLAERAGWERFLEGRRRSWRTSGSCRCPASTEV